MFAVGSYLLRPQGLGALQAIGQKMRSFVTPYILLTSQWQEWNIFSPNPVQRVGLYALSMTLDDRIIEIKKLDPASLAWHHRTREIKILERVAGGWSVLQQSYLRSQCKNVPIAKGKTIHLKEVAFTLPFELEKLAHIAENFPTQNEKILASALCPP